VNFILLKESLVWITTVVVQWGAASTHVCRIIK
jgi:hypothetical protein